MTGEVKVSVKKAPQEVFRGEDRERWDINFPQKAFEGGAGPSLPNWGLLLDPPE